MMSCKWCVLAVATGLAFSVSAQTAADEISKRMPKRASVSTPAEVRLDARVYELDGTLRLGPEHSNLTIVGADGTRFTRSVPCQSGATVAGDFGPLPDREFFSEISAHAPLFFYDHKWAVEARWPNEGWALFTNSVVSGVQGEALAGIPPTDETLPGAFQIDSKRPASWDFKKGVWLCGYFTYDWAFERLRAASFSATNGVLTMAAKAQYGINGGRWGDFGGRRFYATGIRSELDAPGEYYFDRETKRVDFIAPEGMREFRVATKGGPVIEIVGATNLVLRGLDVEYAVGDGIVVRDSANVRIERCRVRNVGGSGIVIEGGARCAVCDSTVGGTGLHGVRVSGGDRRNLVAGGHSVERCRITGYGKVRHTYAVGVHLAGCGNRVAANRISDAPHTAVIYGGNDHLIESNEVWNILAECGDAGAFYTGRDPLSRGNLLRGNYVHDIGLPGSRQTIAFYLDDCDAGDTLLSNRIERVGVGVMFGGGQDNHLVGNVFRDCLLALSLDERALGWATNHWDNPNNRSWQMTRKVKEMDVTREPWRSRYPLLVNYLEDSPREPRHVTIAGNVFERCRKTLRLPKRVERFKPDIRDNVMLPAFRIAGEIGARFETAVRGNFLKTNLEGDFFKPFAERKSGAGVFIGLGKHADAAVHFAKNTLDPAVIAAKEKIIDFIVRNQLPDGYTGCYAEKFRLARQWDIHEMGFIIQGLMSDWELFGNRAALEAAKRNVDYVLDRWNDMPDNWELTWLTDRETTLGFGFGVARLYAATKDEKYRSFLRVQRGLDDWNDPIVIGRDKMIYGQAYGYTGTCLEQLELYRWDPRPRYLETSLRALDFQTKGDGLLIDGNGGIAECWTNDQDGEGEVGETCTAVFNLLFWDSMMKLGVADKALLGDLMERTVYNALFAAMSSDGRRLRYYTPLNGERKFWHGDLYCCPNNFRRGMSRLPEYLFYPMENAVLANLYTACEADFDVAGTRLHVVEETDYPKSGKVKFTLYPERTASFAFKVRVPRWCRNPSVFINGMRVTYKYRPGQILNLPKAWKKGDTVELDFPMEVRTVRGRKRQSGRFAVMRGPVVYALDTKTVKAFKGMHPYDAQTILMMDPNRLAYRDGQIDAVISTVAWAVGIDDVAVDQGRESTNVCRVRLEPFASENANLTYFRAPNLEQDCRNEDELFVAP